ncbi:MAG TPA: hypothetical protein VHJ19_05625, partial [Gammaproteobacteria bacterium]|nr:hypothetical protein [Gammaproteobacteria bacterium]
IFDLSALSTNGHNNHWTRNVIISLDGQNPYVSVSLAIDVGGEHIDARILAALRFWRSSQWHRAAPTRRRAEKAQWHELGARHNFVVDRDQRT